MHVLQGLADRVHVQLRVKQVPFICPFYHLGLQFAHLVQVPSRRGNIRPYCSVIQKHPHDAVRFSEAGCDLDVQVIVEAQLLNIIDVQSTAELLPLKLEPMNAGLGVMHAELIQVCLIGWRTACSMGLQLLNENFVCLEV